jgi:hypothetical protein
MYAKTYLCWLNLPKIFSTDGVLFSFGGLGGYYVPKRPPSPKSIISVRVAWCRRNLISMDLYRKTVHSTSPFATFEFPNMLRQHSENLMELVNCSMYVIAPKTGLRKTSRTSLFMTLYYGVLDVISQLWRLWIIMLLSNPMQAGLTRSIFPMRYIPFYDPLERCMQRHLEKKGVTLGHVCKVGIVEVYK